MPKKINIDFYSLVNNSTVADELKQLAVFKPTVLLYDGLPYVLSIIKKIQDDMTFALEDEVGHAIMIERMKCEFVQDMQDDPEVYQIVSVLTHSGVVFDPVEFVENLFESHSKYMVYGEEDSKVALNLLREMYDTSVCTGAQEFCTQIMNDDYAQDVKRAAGFSNEDLIEVCSKLKGPFTRKRYNSNRTEVLYTLTRRRLGEQVAQALSKGGDAKSS